MKKAILMKTILLLAVFSFSTASMAQTDSLANLFYHNVQTNNNVLRFEDNALASVRFDNGQISGNLQYYLIDETGAIIAPKQTTNTWDEVLFENLVLDVDYSIHTSFQGQEYIVGSFHTRDNSLEPFEASENLFNALETWYEKPQETRPEAGSFLLQSSTVPFFESVAYLQALYDMPFLPNSLLEENSEANIIDIWVDYGDPKDSTPTPPYVEDEVYEEILFFKPLDPYTLDKCICQYTLESGGFKDDHTKYIDKEHSYSRSYNKRHFNLGAPLPKANTETYEIIERGFAGPAKSIDFTLKGWKTSGLFYGGTIDGKDGNLTSTPNNSIGDHHAGIKMRLFCDGLPEKIRKRIVLMYDPNGEAPDLSFLIRTPAEECLCTKEVEICWRYDANIYAQAKEGGCNAGNKAAVTVQDYTEVSLQQGSSSKQVIDYGKTTVQAKCNTNYIDKQVKTVELAAINQELLSIQAQLAAETDPVKRATLNAKYAATLAKFVGKNGEIEKLVDECGSDNQPNDILPGCRVITLKNNESVYFNMNNGYKIEAEGKDCFYAIASIQSDFYLSAIMRTPNVTPTDVKYCCSKKWGRYQLASFSGAPESLAQIESEVGVKFDDAGPWDAPYHYLPYNPAMVHDMDVLTGGRICDDLIFDNTRTIKKDEAFFDEVRVKITGQNLLQIANLPSTNESIPSQIILADMMGKVLVNTSTYQQALFIDNLPLRKGIYFISFISGDNFKTLKILNYE